MLHTLLICWSDFRWVALNYLLRLDVCRDTKAFLVVTGMAPVEAGNQEFLEANTGNRKTREKQSAY